MYSRLAKFVFAVAGIMLGVATAAPAGDTAYRRMVDGVVVYFGMLPAELVRGHPPAHPESGMHGGVPVGENHLTGPDRFKATKKLEPMIIAGSATYGNYFSMPGPGPYRIVLHIQAPDARQGIEAVFALRGTS